ncbi:Cilia- and flagella-associated protein 47 [Rhizophlyctis rosea]|uniref:Cilia- and flagella-associated protein 47 n=1 Tax=Rhizophlyctis rosea TaxID=64517 RepID=A0AAD5SM56_9FUNG|nr:Cilia- and flagella-associated protein 47 [Rhizophlyctis rosea]
MVKAAITAQVPPPSLGSGHLHSTSDNTASSAAPDHRIVIEKVFSLTPRKPAHPRAQVPHIKSLSTNTPNIPASRATLFTDLTAPSTRSTRAAEARANLADFWGVRVFPRQLSFHDYVPGERRIMMVHLGNFTERAKRVWLRPPGKVKWFRIVKGGDVDGSLVAPGMDVCVGVEFCAPSGGNVGVGKGGRPLTGPGDDLTLKVWKDLVGFEVEGEAKILEVPLEATPAGPRLQAPEEVDFGVVVASKGMDGKGKREENGDGWVTKQIQIVNVGPRTGRFLCTWDKYAPVRVQPTLGTLAAGMKQNVDVKNAWNSTSSLSTSNTCTLQVSYLPRDIGPLDEILHIDIYNHFEQQPGRKAVASGPSTPLSSVDIQLKGETVEHKLRLCTLDGTRDLDPSNLNFGTVHYSRTARLKAKLENRGPTPIKWVITHAGESLPMVPPQLLGGSTQSLNQTSDDIDSRASISVFPTEGVLAPYHSTPLTFTFAPRILEPELGFKSAQPPPPTRNYSVPMHLKIIPSGQNALVGTSYPEAPMALNLSGRACPVAAQLSAREIAFPDTRKGRSETYTLRFVNSGSELEFKFQFEVPAHFHVAPARGHMKPNTERDVSVTFKPNQLGIMRSKIICIVEAVDDFDERYRREVGFGDDLKGLVDIVGNGREVARIPLIVHAVCSPHAETGQETPEPSTAGVFGSARISPLRGEGAHPRSHRRAEGDSKESVYIRSTTERAKEEWEAKATHRQKYIDYLVNSRLDKLKKMRTDMLGNDGVEFDVRLEERQMRDGRIDKESGLTEPEPVDCLEVIENAVAGSKAGDEEQKKISRAHSSLDRSALSQLFQRLLEFKPPSPQQQLAQATNVTGSAPLDAPLTGVDLSCIYCNTQQLTFSTTTVHSTAYIPLNFLNAMPGKKPIQITISADAMDGDELKGSSADDKGHLDIQPVSLVVPPFTIAGVWVSFRGTAARTFERKLSYLVNGRYRYRIPVTANVVPVDLEIETDRVEINVDTRETLSRGEEQPLVAESEVGDLASVGMLRKSATIQVSNPGTSPAMFSFRVLEDEKPLEGKQEGKAGKGVMVPCSPAFSIQPSTYTLAPSSSCPVTITYTPSAQASRESTIEMQVVDPSSLETQEQNTKQIRCLGSILPTSVNMNTGIKAGGPLEFGNLCVGVDPIVHGADANQWNQLLCAPLFQSGAGSSISSPNSTPSPFTKIVKLKNTSHNPCVFTATPISGGSNVNADISVYPSMGMIPPATTQDVSVTVLPTTDSGPTDAYISINPLGCGKTFRAHVRYNAIRPRVRVTTETGDARLSMDGTVVGSLSTKTLGIVNESGVTVRCVVDLRWHAEFELAVGEGARSAIASAAPSERRTEKSRSTMLGSGRSTKSGKDVPDANAVYMLRVRRFKVIGKDDPYMGQIPSLTSDVNTTEEGNVYVFDILGNETFPLILTYRPTTARPTHFSMPVLLLGAESCIFLPVVANPTPTPLTISRRSVAFKPKVVHRDSAASVMAVSHLTAPAKEIVWLTNETEAELEWWVDTDDIEGAGDIFKVEPWRGTLDPRPADAQNFVPGAGTQAPPHMAPVTITFHPPHTGNFTATIPLHTDALGMRPSFHISLVGKGVEPSIAFDPPEIFLPVVPPGWESAAVVSIINHGCERTEIAVEGAEGSGVGTGSAVAPAAESPSGQPSSHPLLSMHYPEGKLLKSDGERLTFEVRLNTLSSQPKNTGNAAINFTTKLAVMASQSSQRAFYLPVHGISEASLWTLLPFLWTSKSDVKLSTGEHGEIVAEKIGGVVTLDENQKRTRILTSPRPFRTPYGIPLENGPSHESIDAFYTSLMETLSRWLDNHFGNTTVCDVENVIQQLDIQSGKVAVRYCAIVIREAVKHYGPVKLVCPNANPDDRAKTTRKLYADLLTHLISLGAILSPIRPEFLLPFEDFKRIAQNRVDAMKADQGYTLHDEDQEYLRKVEQYFNLIQKEAWAMVLLQCVKVFVGQNVTARQLRTLPGLDEDVLDLDVSVGSLMSNVYGACESILLKWVGYHVQKVTGESIAFTNFTTDFRDSLAISQLIESHLPEFGQERFEYMHQYPTTEAQLLENAKTLQAALAELFPNCSGITFSPAHIASGNQPCELLLLLLLLYQNLPSYIPRGTIEFHGTLHEKDTRYIELSNSTPKTIWYTAEIEGSPEFSLDEPTAAIQVPPKSVIRVPIHFVGKFSRAVNGKLTLRSRKMGLNEGSVLAFALSATVEPAPPTKLMKVEAPMYATPPPAVNAEVVNPFPIKGTFKVELRQIKRTEKKSNVAQAPEVASSDSTDPAAFRTSVETLELEAGESFMLPIVFLPFEFGIHECIIHLSDEAVGEFSYQIEGRASLPQPAEAVTITTKSSSPAEKTIRISPINLQRDKALYALTQASIGAKPGAGRGKGKDAEKDAEKSKGKREAPTNTEAMQLPKKAMKYKVDYSSPYFQGPAEITINPAVELPTDKKHLMSFEQNYSELQVVFSPKHSGKYYCRLTLTCPETSDVRVFAINGVAISEGSKAELEFTTPARQPLSQEIPIVNKTDEDWTIKAHLQGLNFQVPQSITVKARTSTPIPITFRPTRPGTIHALLTLSNLQTSQKHTYHLHGVALDPLPEDTKEVTCEARDRVELSFLVRNYTERDADYDVVSDVPGGEGADRVWVAKASAEEYRMIVHARSSGTFQNVVTFVNKGDHSYVWFIVKLTVNPPPPEDTLSIFTTVRKAVGAEIRLWNPLDHPITYIAEIEGEGLLGPREFAVNANENKMYLLTYAPLLSSIETGRIKFINPEIGEFWYKLQLEAHEAPPVQLTPMECSLGKCTAQSLTLTNPLSHAVTVTITISNPRLFQIIHPPVPSGKLPIARLGAAPPASYRVTLEALCQTEVQLVYWPSSLTENEKTKVEVSSEEIGNEVFLVEGHGLLPTLMPVHHINAPLSTATTSSITFTNPFIDPVAVTISLEQSEGENDFALILHRRMAGVGANGASGGATRIHVGGLESFEIPFSYTPEDMEGGKATVRVVLSKEVQWEYPIRGIPELSLTSPNIALESRVREKVHREIKLVLPEFVPEPDSITDERPEEADLTKWFECGVERPSAHPLASAREDEEADEAAECVGGVVKAAVWDVDGGLVATILLTCTPTTPTDTPLHLHIRYTPTHALWRFPLRLIAHPPSLDDQITIEGAIGRLSSVTFDLRNDSSQPREFKAYFSSGPEGQFEVYPQKGVLVPEEEKKEGDNRFVVGYRAGMYGRVVIGVLVVECADISWSFEIRGVTPASRYPSAGSASSSQRRKMVTGAGSDVGKRNGWRGVQGNQQLTRRRNFVRTNAMNPKVAAVEDER